MDTQKQNGNKGTQTMIRDDFIKLFESIPGGEGGVIHAHELSDGFYLGKVSDCPFLLIPESAIYNLDINYRLSHVEIYSAKKSKVKSLDEIFEANFVIVQCTSQNDLIRKWLLVIIEIFYCQMIDNISHVRFKELIMALIDLVRAVDAVPKSTIIGLIGELLLILSAKNTQAAVEAWHVAISSRIDFTFQDFKLEIKTTSTSKRSHVIKQSQIDLIDDKKLVIASVIIEQCDNGKNIYDLVQDIKDKLHNKSKSIAKLMNLVTDLIGIDLIKSSDYRIDIRTALNSIQFHDSSEIPLIENKYISPYISNLTYLVDFSKLKELNMSKDFIF